MDFNVHIRLHSYSLSFFRYIKLDHVSILQFHSCTIEAKYKLWEKHIHRKGFKVTKNTRVCSNHFVHGAPTKDSPDPVLYMKGYPFEIYQKHNIVSPTNAKSGKKRKAPMEREFTMPVKKGR